MLAKLAARTGPLLGRTYQPPLGRLLLRRDWAASNGHLAIFGALALLCIVMIWPIFGSDYPPGVDTATFLHLSWVTKLAASGQLADPFQDPYWYGGFSYLVSYPPLSYGLVGVVSFVSRIDFVLVYQGFLSLAYIGVAVATYWLALEMGVRRWTATLAAIFVALSYPLLSAIFLWGWFTTVLALPLGLVSIVLLEKALRSARWKTAAWGGLCMALCILTHHMTGLALGLGMVGWFGFQAAAAIVPRREVVKLSAVFVVVTVVVVAPWGIPSVIHMLDVGFRREIPGIWQPSLAMFRNNIIDSSRIGDFIYPSYLGVTLVVLATGGTVFALMERRRLAGMAILLVVLFWFSLGANLNPLIRVYPFSGLDVARFHLLMVPFMAVLGGVLVERIFYSVKELWTSGRQRLGYGLVVAGLAAILVFPIIDALKARGEIEPYRVEGSVNETISWLAEKTPPTDGTPIASTP